MNNSLSQRPVENQTNLNIKLVDILGINIDYIGLSHVLSQLSVTAYGIKLINKSLGVFMINSFLKTGIASALLFVCASSAATQSPLIASNKVSTQFAETRIVGGEQATKENWPWITAYVGVYTDFLTSLSVNDVVYDTRSFSSGGPGQAVGQAIGQIISCGIGDVICADATGKVCLIERGDINFSEKADNCEAGGGIGAIIYNDKEEGNFSGTLGDKYAGAIPVVAVTREDGLILLEQVGNIASLSVSETAQLQQESTCGASFLGDKWVLTAAHCVEDGNPLGFKMNVGEYDLSDGAENAIDIANIYIHPLYDTDSINNDIAIIELVSSVDATAVQIADVETTEQYAIENSVATVAGWGGRVGYAPNNGPTSDYPEILHKVDLALSTNQQCKEALAATLNTSVNNTGITDVMICAAIPEGGKGSCQGDSGGPLVINTGSGVQQVGIVSWGYGCAEGGYPGVYTRVSEFKPWIAAITQGIAVTTRHDFGVSFKGEQKTTELTVTNNSASNVGLSFELSGSSHFTFDASQCATLDAGSSCQLSINYLPTVASDVSTQLMITADNQVPTASAMVSAGTTISSASELTAIIGTESDAITLFSGGSNGASGWAANSVDGIGIESGTSGDLQDSILVAKITGKGVLTFDWSVSSEENTDDPDAPFDALYLYVDGELFSFISGEVAFSEYTIELPEGSHLINWTYTKDDLTAEGKDKGFIRNLVFTQPVVVTPPVVKPPTPPSKSGGGGSLGWMMWCLFGLIFRLRTKL